jgi:hypothetical protein
MSRFGIDRHWQAFDGLSATSSTYTSNPFHVADAATLSVSIVTNDTGASRFTLQASNDQGFTAAITNWSVVTAITAQGFYSIDPGARWHRWLRSSLESLSTVQQQMWVS